MDRRARWLVLLASAGLAVVLLSVTGGAIWAAAGVDRAVQEIEHISAQRDAWVRAELELVQEESIVHGYLVEPSRDLRHSLEEVSRSLAGAIDFLATQGEPDDADSARKIKALHADTVDDVRRILAAMDAGDTALARAIHEQPVHPAHATMQYKISGFADREEEEVSERLAELRRRQHGLDASIGIAVYPEHGGDAAELLQHADVAMYAAKHTHAGFVVYDPAVDQHSPRRLALLGGLRRALERDELVLYYQPKADVDSGRVLGVEALVRWQHPDHGLLGPGEFIPLAERTGLIHPLTRWVLDAALRQAAEWHRAGHHVSVAVNVSTRSLLDQAFPDQVAEQLAAWQVPADRLVLEITESAVMADPALALDVLGRLHALGVGLAIDDFGTGYSSMAYLKALPVDELKVDRSFVGHMASSPSDAVIVRSTIDLGHNLGLRVVAEGVETRATWETLKNLGCDTAQGYLLGKPMPADELEPWLERPVDQGTAAGPEAPAPGRPVSGP